jgi:type I restriction enzyme S subunit
MKKIIPELRFPEFVNDGDWVEIELGQISRTTTGNSNREDSTKEKGKYTFFDRSQDIRTSNRFLFDGEAIIIAGEGQEFKPKYFIGKFDLHQRAYAILDFDDKVIGKFLFYSIYKNRSYFLRYAVGSTVKSLRLPIFEDMPTLIPSNSKEQQKIASCLTALDELITAHNNKLDTLKDHKKGLMQNLFPQEGQKVPNYRFPEFENDGEWVEKKLGDIVEIGRGKSKHRPRDAEFLFDGKYPFIQTGDIRKAGLYLTEFSRTYSEAGLKQSKLWNENTLCITIAATIAETSILKIKACFPDSVIGLTTDESKIKVLFVKYSFDVFKERIRNLSQGVAQDNLNQEKLSKIEFAFPSPTEQQKTATCLSSLDELINTQKEKINELQQHKKGLMQGLFPKIES